MVDNVYSYIRDIKKYALSHNVPIMLDDGIDFMTSFIQEHKCYNILEIGSAIGYSAIMMALSNPEVKIITIEKDQNRYLEALKNIKKLELEDRITLLYRDALDVKFEDKFDLIFIDAAKSKNKTFFKMFAKNLADNGYIITDNMNFHGLVNKDIEKIESKNVRGIVRKIKDYKSFLEETQEFSTEFLSVGDGIAVSKRRNE